MAVKCSLSEAFFMTNFAHQPSIDNQTVLSSKFFSLSSIAQHQRGFTKHVSYGTAGFRENADSLPMDSIMFRMGCVAALRSRTCGGAVCGVMVTASHNPMEDNGVKMIESDGGMLASSWESVAEFVANALTTDDLANILSKAVADEHVAGIEGNVFVACDTRDSSDRFVRCVMRGVEACSGRAEYWGLVSTPALHHIVRHTNGFGHGIHLASEEGYLKVMVQGYRLISKFGKVNGLEELDTVIDCAGGVGYRLVEKVNNLLRYDLSLTVLNGPSTCKLNDMCGAEFVQKGRVPPAGDISREKYLNRRMASLDGDADRLVYSVFMDDSWHLLDGDKIMALLCVFVSRELEHLEGLLPSISVGAVQTAYANGASGRFIEETAKGVTLKLAKTGVKYVEACAHDFDIGAYFEANGHGTVLFKQKIVETFERLTARHDISARQKEAAEKLYGLSLVLNQAVGDAIGDFLAVEAVLRALNMSTADWIALYQDLPSRQGKIYVADRSVVKCSEDETKALKPAELQGKIDILCSQYSKGRAFVRPSGTEDAVRIYAEAENQELANELAFKVAKMTHSVVGPASGKPFPRAEEYGCP